MPGGIVYKDQKHIFEIRVKITPRCFFVPNVTLLFMFIFFYPWNIKGQTILLESFVTYTMYRAIQLIINCKWSGSMVPRENVGIFFRISLEMPLKLKLSDVEM